MVLDSCSSFILLQVVDQFSQHHLYILVMVSLVVMYGCESWNIKKAERWRIDALELWWWRTLLRVCWTERWSVNTQGNQSWIFIGRTDAESPILLMPRANSFKKDWCWERLKAGGAGDDRGWDGWMASPTQWTWVWASSRRRWRAGMPGILQSMGSQILDTTEWLNNWTLMRQYPLLACHQCLVWKACHCDSGSSMAPSPLHSFLPSCAQGRVPETHSTLRTVALSLQLLPVGLSLLHVSWKAVWLL